MSSQYSTNDVTKKKEKTPPKYKVTFNAPVTLIFGAICVVALLLSLVTAGKTNDAIFMTYHSGLANPMTWLRFFTHVFGHSGWAHLIGNMSYILLLGPLLEEKYGSGVLVGVIALTAFVTGIVNYIFFPNAGLLGASGVVFAFILLSSVTSFKDGEIPLTFILVAVIYIGQQIFDGIFVKDNVANFAHILGGIIGAIMGFVLQKGRKSKS